MKKPRRILETIAFEDRRIVVIGLGLAAVLLASSAAISTIAMRRIESGESRVEQALERLDRLGTLTGRLESFRRNTESPIRDSGDGASWFALSAHDSNAIAEILSALSGSTGSDASARSLAIALETAVTTELANAVSPNPASPQQVRDASDGAVDAFERAERSRLAEHGEFLRRSSQTSIVIGIGAAIAVFLTLWFFFRHIRSLELARAREARIAKTDIERHRDLLHNAGDAVLTADMLGRITSLNPPAERLTGWSRSEAVGQALDHVVRLESGQRRAWQESSDRLRSTRDSREPAEHRAILRTKDGSTRVIEQNAAVFRDELGARRGVIVVLRDVTMALENERALQERVALAEFESEVIANLLADGRLETILLRCAEVIQRRLEGAFTSVWIVRDGLAGIELVANAGEYAHIEESSRAYPIGESKVRKIAESKQPLLVNRVVGDERIANQDWAIRERLKAFAGYPLLIEGRVVGVLAMFARHDLSSATLQAFSLVASALAITVERKLAERELEQREARFRSLVIASTQMVWRADASGIIVDDVSSWRAVTGEEFDSFHGEGWLAFVHPDDYARVIETWRVGIDSGATFSCELRLRRSDGPYRLVAMRAVPIVDEHGVIREWIGTHTDITDQREAERQLRESEDRYRALVELSPQAVWLADADGGITYANQWWLEYSGLTIEEHADLAALEVVHPDHVERLREVVSEQLRGARVWTLEVPLRRASDGRFRWHYIRAQRIENGDARAARWIAIAIDIDDRKRNERERERLAFLVENSRDFIGIFDGDGRCSYLNRAGMRLVGIEEARDLPAIRLAELTHEAERGIVSEILLPRAEREGAANCELRFRHRSTGAFVWMDFGVLAMRGADGAIDGFATISREITERKAAQEEIAASQRFLRCVLDALASQIAVLDDRGTILATNRAWRDSITVNGLDASSHEIGTNHLASLESSRHVAPEHVSPAIRAIRGVMAGESETEVIEYRIAPPSSVGAEVWIQMRVTRFADSDAARVVVAYEDITQRVRSEIATRRRSEQLRRLAQLAADLSVLHDVETILGVVTAGTRTIFGAKNSIARVHRESVSDSELRVTSPNEAPTAPCDGPAKDDSSRFSVLAEELLIEHVRRTNRPVRITAEEIASSPSFTARTVEMSSTDRCWMVAPLNRLDGENEGVLLLGDSKRSEFTSDDEAMLIQVARMTTIAIDNARLYGRLLSHDRRKDQFLATLSHELRNPLAPIRFWLEILKADSTPTTLLEARTVIDAQVRHMVRLIDDLLDLSRISFDKLELRRERVDLIDLIAAAVESSRPAIEAKRQSLARSLPNGQIMLDADPTRIAQVVSNLLNNASKYSSEGGRISLAVRRDGDEVVIVVSDEGIGISPEALPRIFEPFVQDARARARSDGGLGIGLSLVRRITELHQGTVVARSDGPGRGSIFEVRLPIVPDDSLETPESGGSVSSNSISVDSTKNRNRRRILLVDDNVHATTSLARLLRMIGHECREANDGKRAIEIASTFRPEIVLLDIGLPDLTGYDLAQHIRDAEGPRKLVMIAITGWGQPEDRQRSNAAGFDHHLVKPVDFDALVRLLDSLDGV